MCKPIQFAVHTQWWSIFKTHRLHYEQWWLLSGLNILQGRQYRLAFFSSGVNPANYSLSSSIDWIKQYNFRKWKRKQQQQQQKGKISLGESLMINLCEIRLMKHRLPQVEHNQVQSRLHVEMTKRTLSSWFLRCR